MEAKIEKISEFSKLLSVKTRMSEIYFIFLVSLALVTCYLACHWRNAWVTTQHLMATISGNDKELSKILVMAEALEKWDEVYGQTT